MTFREKLAQEHPEDITESACRACWDRQMPLPPEEKEVPTAPHEIPQTVRNLVEARIHQLTEQVKALEDERDALCDWLNER
jgi:hypothetical protein